MKDELNFEDSKYENSHEANEELLTTLDDNNQEDIKDIKLGMLCFLFYFRFDALSGQTYDFISLKRFH